MICKHCGQEINSKSLYCTYCGNKIELVDIVPKSKSNKIVPIILGVIVALFIGFMAIGIISDASKVSGSYVLVNTTSSDENAISLDNISMTLDFNNDGSVIQKVSYTSSYNRTYKGTWSQSDTTLTININNGVDTGEVDGNKITLNSGGYIMIFQKAT